MLRCTNTPNILVVWYVWMFSSCMLCWPINIVDTFCDEWLCDNPSSLIWWFLLSPLPCTAHNASHIRRDAGMHSKVNVWLERSSINRKIQIRIVRKSTITKSKPQNPNLFNSLFLFVDCSFYFITHSHRITHENMNGVELKTRFFFCINFWLFIIGRK